ncbi:MAG TPA: hypothetical protein VKD70_06190 [Candidatus Acidoferrum sp.]|nr:hypothetical protein [Candidatus Acidoferrum sp.]
MNLITFDSTWLRPWVFYAVEDEATRAMARAVCAAGRILNVSII